MGSIYSIEDFLDMLRRRAGLILSVFVLGSLAALFYAASLSHLYRASEVIQIAQPRISDDLARSTVDGSAARRLQLIQQRLMTRSSLLEIIDQYGLYQDLAGLTDAERAQILRESVRIEGVAAAGGGADDPGAMSVLTVTAEMPTAEQARQIAHEFAQRTIALSNQTRLDQAAETLAFLSAREQAITAEISRLEDELAQYRLDNDLTLPGTVEFRRAEIATINDGLLEIARERIRLEREMDQVRRTERPATAERKLADLAEDLATLDAQAELLRDHKAGLEASIQSSPAVDRRIGAYERQLEQLRDELEQVAQRRTEAEIGHRLEVERQAERLTVIEPAEAPDYPFTRSRKKVAALGIGASLVLGVVLAFLAELRRPVIRSAAQMERELGFKPVVSIPYLDTRPPRPSLSDRLRGHDPEPDPAPDSPTQSGRTG